MEIFQREPPIHGFKTPLEDLDFQQHRLLDSIVTSIVPNLELLQRISPIEALRKFWV